MSTAPSPLGFAPAHAAAAAAPLAEALPADPGDEPAAFGFLLAWALAARPQGLIVCAAPDAACGEWGDACAEGAAQFGADLSRLLIVRTRTQDDALWAAEQALETPDCVALCVIAQARKALSLTAARRLILRAQEHRTRALLLRLDGQGAAAAWTRWRVSAAASVAEDRLLGPPRFNVTLARNRAGAIGQNFIVEWNADERVFLDRTVAGARSAASDDRSAAPRRPRAA